MTLAALVVAVGLFASIRLGSADAAYGLQANGPAISVAFDGHR
jgi:hypothetical protein